MDTEVLNGFLCSPSSPDVTNDTSVLDPSNVVSSHYFLSVRIDDVDGLQLVTLMSKCMARRCRLKVVHVNAWLLTLAKDRPWLQRFVIGADLVYADGVGAQLAQYLLTGSMPARSTAPEWISDLGYLMAAEGRSIFWLGCTEITIRKAAEMFSLKTGVKLAGYHHGYFHKAQGSAENQAVVDMINASNPDFLVLNMGMPIRNDG